MEVMFDDMRLWLFSPTAVVPCSAVVVSLCTILLSWRFLRREWNFFWQLGEHGLQERRLPWFPSLARHAEIRFLSHRHCGELRFLSRFTRLQTLLLYRPRDVPESVFVSVSRVRTLQIYASPTEDCSLTALPESLGNMVELRVLELTSCRLLSHLPESLGRLAALTRLQISCCDALTALPASLGQLAALTTLMLGYSPHLTALPDSLGQLQALKSLRLSGFPVLRRLPESLGRLAALEVLNLQACEALTALPNSLGQLASLRMLKVSSTGPDLTALPDSLGQLARLTTLDLRYCYSLTALPESLGRMASLGVLVLVACRSLTRLPESLGQLAALQRLDISDCSRLEGLPFSFLHLGSSLAMGSVIGAESLSCPPQAVAQQGTRAIQAFLLLQHQRLKVLLLILGARRRRIRHPPAELWALIHRDHLSG